MGAMGTDGNVDWSPLLARVAIREGGKQLGERDGQRSVSVVDRKEGGSQPPVQCSGDRGWTLEEWRTAERCGGGGPRCMQRCGVRTLLETGDWRVTFLDSRNNSRTKHFVGC